MSDIDVARYAVTVFFNSRLRGSGQVHTAIIDAVNVTDAIDAVTDQAVRLPGHGQAVFVTGATAFQVKG